jgi:hypothetical protein
MTIQVLDSATTVGVPEKSTLAAEHFGVEAPGAFDVVRDDEVAQQNSLWGRRELGHLVPPLVRSHAPLTTGAAADITLRARLATRHQGSGG